MRPGDRTEIRVDALPGARFCGTVESLSGASGSEFAVIPPDNATGNFTKIVRRFPVRIRLDADQPGLDAVRVGMSVVPRAALGSAADGRAHASGLDRLVGIMGGGGFACESNGPVRLDPPRQRRLPEHPGIGAAEARPGERAAQQDDVATEGTR